MPVSPRLWVVIPAAGIGTRMQVDTPKQYLTLCGRTILEHSMAVFYDHARISGVTVVLAPRDSYWEQIQVAGHEKVSITTGGAERYHSVYNGLLAVARKAEKDDWVLVHDAARPCLRRTDLDLLIDTLNDHPVGGILAVPARDTMKRAGKDSLIRETVDRNGLWHALTPQMFRLGLLQKALEQAFAAERGITDESEAMEAAGHLPVLVEGHADNIKVTRNSDLPLVELFLSSRETSA